MATKKTPAQKKAAQKKGPTTGPKARHNPTSDTRAAAAALSDMGIPHKLIAGYIGVARSTLQKHYKDEIDGTGDGCAAIAVGTLVSEMLKGGRVGASCAMFWLKTRRRDLFSEKVINENIELTDAQSVSRLAPEDQERVANNVIKQLQQQAANGKTKPSIHDKAAGTA